jgi:hypothetical protein
MAVTAEIAQAAQTATAPALNEVPPEFSWVRNFSVISFIGGGYLLQQEGGKWARAFSSMEDLVDYFVAAKRASFNEDRLKVHSDLQEFKNNEPSPHDYREPMVSRRRGARDDD